MNKKIMLIIAASSFLSACYADVIKVAPLAVYDSDGKKTAVPFNPAKAIHSELEKHWFEGLVNFFLISESSHGIPVTVSDANRICMSENADYLIYGYIKKNETNWLAEVKLYSASEKKTVREFFACDGIGHYDRLIDVLCRNILHGTEEITGLNQDELKKQKMRPMELRIPSSVFYWSPADARWGNKILGIAGISTGLEFYPELPVTAAGGKLVDFSLRLNLSWDIGMNRKDCYPLILNTMAVSLPALVHVHFNEAHSLHAGFGLAYGIEFMNIRPKYEDEKFLYQNVFSLEAVAGYEFRINRSAGIFTELVFDWHLMSDGFVSVKPCIGASFSIFKENR
ncbi:MAG: hypothetical protein ACI4LX_05120 [Treponema sp.]